MLFETRLEGGQSSRFGYGGSKGKYKYVREKVLSCCFIFGAGNQRGWPSLSISNAEELPPPSRGFSLESRLKPEKNKEQKVAGVGGKKKKKATKKTEVKSMGWELEGPLQVAQAWQLVLGLWDSLSQRLNNSGSKPEHTQGLWVCGGWATRVNPPPPLQPDIVACCLFLSLSAQVRSMQTPLVQGMCLHPGCRLVGPVQAQSCWLEAAPWCRLTPPKGSCRCQWPRSCMLHSGASPRTPWH